MNPMPDRLIARIGKAFTLTHDLVSHLDEPALGFDLPGLPSNRIASQLWCIVGARESYLRAIEAGNWQGFACSLKTPRSKAATLGALEATHRDLRQVDPTGWTDAQLDLALALLEHEVQHHGQLIRYIYANGLTFPRSWNQRYTV